MNYYELICMTIFLISAYIYYYSYKKLNKLISGHNYNDKIVVYHSFCRRWRGVFSLSPSIKGSGSPPLQFPVHGPRQNEFTTLRAAVFLKNSLALGLSLVHPCCL